jgi:hypothetical protein
LKVEDVGKGYGAAIDNHREKITKALLGSLTWIRLEIRRLRLDQPGIDILRSAESVLVDQVMLRRCADHPNIGPFDEEATTTENIDLSLIGIIIQGMVRVPEPHVLSKILVNKGK